MLRTVAMVTDYDSWHPDHGEVDIHSILKVLRDNSDNARRLVERIAGIPARAPRCPIGSDRALEHAIMTAPEKRDPELLKKLDAVAGRVLDRWVKMPRPESCPKNEHHLPGWPAPIQI